MQSWQIMATPRPIAGADLSDQAFSEKGVKFVWMS
jgi:hypothetical protein